MISPLDEAIAIHKSLNLQSSAAGIEIACFFYSIANTYDLQTFPPSSLRLLPLAPSSTMLPRLQVSKHSKWMM
jgi:hypothetical protein